MKNNYYKKNNYDEFYNDWTDCNDGCKKPCKGNYCKQDNCNQSYNDWTDCDDGCRKPRKNDCCNQNIMDDCCMNDIQPCKEEGFDFNSKPIRRCDEDAIEEEINRLFRFILNELCNVEEDIDEITQAFVKLATLLIEDTCLECSEQDLICCVAKDLQALQMLIDKTIRDVKCLKKDVKCR